MHFKAVLKTALQRNCRKQQSEAVAKLCRKNQAQICCEKQIKKTLFTSRKINPLASICRISDFQTPIRTIYTPTVLQASFLEEIEHVRGQYYVEFSTLHAGMLRMVKFVQLPV